ncbi:uncharacterized protein LOC123878779 [Maniola jurtina]|uniref:uncharacterized protein LOC123878779 n=1 Tax=Maniola jurtina TaxID=191418 RepID=UPI001E68B26A|nr:uncharacterized protein LOC123878779 [Maniola jurtina]
MSVLIIVLLQHIFLVSSLSRQKRCIVIQKQSGTHGDSSEGEEDRDVEPRRPEKRSDDRYDRRNAEKMPPDSEFLRYKISPMKKLDDIMRYKNKLTSLKNRFV